MKRDDAQSKSGILSSGVVIGVGTFLSLTTGVLAIIAWGQMNDWGLTHPSLYKIFPLFGLMAFSLLLSQYIILALIRFTRADIERVQPYFEVSGFLVLWCIMLHPGLLVWQLWRDGLGLPPESYLRNYVPPDLGWVAMLGTVSFLIFFAYEFKRVFGERSWWRWIVYLSDVAMLAVFYHGFRLGDQLQGGWYRPVWLVYGILLLASLLYIRGGLLLSALRKLHIKRRSP